MSEIPDPAVSGNPFSTRHVRPGAIPYLFPDGLTCEMLVDRLERAGWLGQIIGPHGSGKSALLATLIASLQSRGHRVELVELHDGQRHLPGGLSRIAQLSAGTLVIVDGYEQLSHWQRLLLRRSCRRHGLGLLVTAHTPANLPTLHTTDPTPALAERIVQYLLGTASAPIDREQLHRLFIHHRGNVRDLLFDLYDAFEAERRR